MDPTQLAHALGVATGRRELAERFVGELRRASAKWRATEAKVGGLMGSLKSAFFWNLTERWCARVEELAAQVEADVAQLRTAEQQAQSSYDTAVRQPPAQPARPEPKRRGR